MIINSKFVCYCIDSRLSFSPDGSLLVVPTGVHRHLKGSSTTPSSSNNNHRSYATHIFVRDNWQTPAASLIGAEEPSVGVRFCPKPFQLLNDSNSVFSPPMFHGNYRWLYAVITIGSIFVYDTQHPHPLFKVSGIHYAAINDVAWSADGRILVACSSDGYLTFIRFAEHALGDLMTAENVPELIKRSQPALYPLQNANGDEFINTAVVNSVGAEDQVEESAAEQREEDEAVKMNVDEIPAKEEEAVKMNVDEIPAVTATATVNTDDSLLKKRKRIQPIQISPLSPAVVHATVTSSPSTVDAVKV